jgi:hypothetical protein
MKTLTWCAAVLSAGVFLGASSPAQAGDIMKLGGTGFTGSNAANATPTVTLLGRPESTADNQEVTFFRPYARGYYHGANGYGYRPWIGYYHPVARALYWGFYRPYAYYRPYNYGYYPGIAFSYSSYYPISTSVAVTVPSVAAYAANSYAGVPATYPPPLASPLNSEVLPIPAPGGSYYYDGGPVAPVPMPDGTRPLPMARPAAPANAVVVNRVAASPAKTKLVYPAYGEELPTPRPATGSPILVKYPGQK